MLQLIRNNSPYTVIILFIITLVLKLPVLVNPALPELLPQGIVYNTIVRGLSTVLGTSSFAWTLFTIVLLFAQAIYLSGIATKRKLFTKSSYTPAFAYIILTSIFPGFNVFSPPLLVVWLLLFVLDIFLRLSQPAHAQKQLFNSGMLIAGATLIQFSAVGYVLLLFSAVMILRSFNAGEWVVATLGLLTPLYFFAGILFLLDKLTQLNQWPSIGISLPRHLAHQLYFIGSVLGVILLSSAGFYVLNDTRQRMAISVRRGWSVVIVTFGVSLIVCIFTPQQIDAAWLCVIPGLSLLSALPLNIEKNKLFSNFIFYFLIAFAVFCQFTFYKYP